MSKFDVEINDGYCKGCGICVTVCKSNCLKIREGYNQSGYYFVEAVGIDDCTGCGACVKLCPEFAVTVYKYKEAV